MFNMLDGTQPFDPDRSGDEGAISERVSTDPDRLHPRPALALASPQVHV